MRINPILYRDESDKGGTAAAETKAATAQATMQSADIAKIVDETIRLREEATTKKAAGITRSMAEQKGLTEAELNAAVEAKLAEKAKALPEAAQKQIDAANAELHKLRLSGAIAKEGAALGLLDAEVALALLPADAIKVNDKGEITGVKEALEKLKETKPYLFGATQKPGAMAQRVSGGGSPGTLSPVEERFYSKNPNIRPK